MSVSPFCAPFNATIQTLICLYIRIVRPRTLSTVGLRVSFWCHCHHFTAIAIAYVIGGGHESSSIIPRGMPVFAKKGAGVESSQLSINLSIVQGSGVGPTLYIILESDL